jgi:hypothetical protein
LLGNFKLEKGMSLHLASRKNNGITFFVSKKAGVSLPVPTRRFGESWWRNYSTGQSAQWKNEALICPAWTKAV